MGQFASLFDPFHYSSGESVASFSDAQHLNFGMKGANPRKSFMNTPEGNPANVRAEDVVNSTPPAEVSHFGGVSYPFSGSVLQDPRQRVIPVAIRTPVRDDTNGYTGTLPSGGGRMGGVWRPRDAVSTISGAGLDSQIEGVRPKIYRGQL